jgi:hypothetical protein
MIDKPTGMSYIKIKHLSTEYLIFFSYEEASSSLTPLAFLDLHLRSGFCF